MSSETDPRPGRQVRITVRLLHGTFDAGSDGSGPAEWPPEPYRLFAALRAGAAGLRLTQGEAAEANAVEALRRLESTPPPVIHASAAELRSHEGFVPVIPDFRTSNPTAIDVGRKNNRLKADAFPAITTSRGWRMYQGAVPSSPEVAFDLDASDLSDDDVRWLREAAVEVPYFGRSTSPALLTVSAPGTLPPPPEGTRALTPGEGTQYLCVWTPGLLDALDDKHRALLADLPMSGRALSTFAAYGYPSTRPLTWRSFEREVAPYRSLVSASNELSELTLALGDQIDVVLLANVGNPHANGRLGIAVSAPTEQLATRAGQVFVDSGWSPAGGGKWLQRSSWVAPSAVYATATPVWLDTSSQDAARARVAELVHRWGAVRDLKMSPSPYLRGASRIDYRRGDHRAWHAAIQFEATLPATQLPRRLGTVDGILKPFGQTRKEDK